MTAPDPLTQLAADELAAARDEVRALPDVAGDYVRRSDVMAQLRQRIDRLTWEDGIDGHRN